MTMIFVAHSPSMLISFILFHPLFILFFFSVQEANEKKRKTLIPLKSVKLWCLQYTRMLVYAFPFRMNEMSLIWIQFYVFFFLFFYASIVSIWSLTKSKSKLASKWGIPTDNSQHVIILDFPNLIYKVTLLSISHLYWLYCWKGFVHAHTYTHTHTKRKQIDNKKIDIYFLYL